MSEPIKTHRGKIRRQVSGVKRKASDIDGVLVRDFNNKYKAWLRRRNLPDFECGGMV